MLLLYVFVVLLILIVMHILTASVDIEMCQLCIQISHNNINYQKAMYSNRLLCYFSVSIWYECAEILQILITLFNQNYFYLTRIYRTYGKTHEHGGGPGHLGPLLNPALTVTLNYVTNTATVTN